MKNLLQLAVLSIVSVVLFSCHYPTSPVDNEVMICSNDNEVTIGFYNGTSTNYYWDSLTFQGNYLNDAYYTLHLFTLACRHDLRVKLEKELSYITIQRKSGTSPIYITFDRRTVINGKSYDIPFAGADKSTPIFPPYPAIQIMDSMRSQCPEFVLTISDDLPHTFHCPQGILPPSITISE